MVQSTVLEITGQMDFILSAKSGHLSFLPAFPPALDARSTHAVGCAQDDFAPNKPRLKRG